jgi:ribonuclease VapC
MFVDASALVAILTGEDGHETLVDTLEAWSGVKITSPLAIFETVTAVCRTRGLAVEEAEMDVRALLASASVIVKDLNEAEGKAALTAFRRFGKGRGHPAQLNMGDCFAYACARTHDVPLLFVGNDFSQTDIRSATA